MYTENYENSEYTYSIYKRQEEERIEEIIKRDPVAYCEDDTLINGMWEG